MISENEKIVISKMIKSGYKVIDVGGNIGEWSKYVIDNHRHIILCIFEPNIELNDKLNDILDYKEGIFNRALYNYAISNERGYIDFWVYNISGMSGLYRRPESVETKCNLGIPKKIKVSMYALDDLYLKNKETIDFVKIDTEGNELNVIKGMKELIAGGYIKTIQFEYGLCWKEQGFKLETAFELLKSFPYRYKLPETGEIVQITEFKPELEDYGGGGLYNYVFSMEPMK